MNMPIDCFANYDPTNYFSELAKIDTTKGVSIRSGGEMMKISKIFSMIICIIFFSLFISCSTSNFNTLKDNFYVEYYAVTEDIDIKDTYGSIERLQSDENKVKISKMGELIKDIEEKVPNSKSRIYEEILNQYNGIVFFQGTYSKWN